MKQKYQHTGCYCAPSSPTNPYFEQHKLAPISPQNEKQYFYQVAYSGFGVGLCAVLKIHSQGRAIPEVKLLERRRTGYAAQRNFSILTRHNSIC